MKEWSRINKDKIAVYREKKKEQIRANNLLYMKKYSIENNEQIKTFSKEYRDKNRSKLLEGKRADYIKNKDKYNQMSKKWAADNKDKIKEIDHFRYLKKMIPVDGFFYIIKFENYIKIGTTNKWERRKGSYENHNPLKMEILKCEWYKDANVQEKIVRWDFKEYKLKGKDWFVNIPSEIISKWITANEENPIMIAV